MVENRITFNPYSYIQIVLDKKLDRSTKGFVYDDLIKFLNKEKLYFDRKVINHFFEFFQEGQTFNSHSIIKLICPHDHMFSILDKNYDLNSVREINKINRESFIQIILSELSLSSFLMNIKKNELNKEEYGLVNFFEVGNNLEEKIIHFVKNKFKTKLGFKELKLLIFRIKRMGNIPNEFDDLLKFSEDKVSFALKETSISNNIKKNSVDITNDELNLMVVENEFFKKKILVEENSFLPPIKDKPKKKKSMIPTKGKRKTLKPKGKGGAKRKSVIGRKSVIKSRKSVIKSRKSVSKTKGRSKSKSVLSSKKPRSSRVSIKPLKSRGKSKSMVGIKKGRKSSILGGKKKKAKKRKSKLKVFEEPVNLIKPVDAKDKETQLIIDSLKFFDEQYDKINKKKETIAFSPFDIEEEKKYINKRNKENKKKKEIKCIKKGILEIIGEMINKVFEKIYNNPKMNKTFIGEFMKGNNGEEDEEENILNFRENILDFKKPKKIYDLDTKSMMLPMRKKTTKNYEMSMISHTLHKKKTLNTANNFNCSFNMKKPGFKSMILPNNYNRKNHETIITNDLQLNNSLDNKKLLTESIVNNRGKLNIINLKEHNSNNSISGELKYKVVELFKKILIYSSKLEELKGELFGNNPRFNLMGIFKIYDEDEDGLLSKEQFERLVVDIGFQLNGLQLDRLMCYLNNFLTKTIEKINTENINFSDFTKLFFPMARDNSQLFNTYYGNQNFKKKKAVENDLVIKESEFHLMRQIVIIMLRKLDDLSVIVRSLRNHDVSDIFKIVSNSMSNINWDILTDFLENSNIKFIDEDLEHVFRDFRSQKFAVINFETFKKFLQHPIWRIQNQDLGSF